MGSCWVETCLSMPRMLVRACPGEPPGLAVDLKVAQLLNRPPRLRGLHQEAGVEGPAERRVMPSISFLQGLQLAQASRNWGVDCIIGRRHARIGRFFRRERRFAPRFEQPLR